MFLQIRKANGLVLYRILEGVGWKLKQVGWGMKIKASVLGTFYVSGPVKIYHHIGPVQKKEPK